MAEATVNWLTDEEQRGWRSILGAQNSLVTALDRELAAEHKLGLADYEVLMHLSEAEGESLRMTDLAKGVFLSPSGLTRRLDSLVKAGLVERKPCESDGRGLFAVLTSEGRAKLEQMAPTHVRGVREHFIDQITADQLRQLTQIFESLPVANREDSFRTRLSEPVRTS